MKAVDMKQPTATKDLNASRGNPQTPCPVARNISAIFFGHKFQFFIDKKQFHVHTSRTRNIPGVVDQVNDLFFKMFLLVYVAGCRL